MTFRTSSLCCLTFLLVSQSNTFGASVPLELKWNELNAAIVGKTIELTLPSSVTIKGEVAVIREDAMVLNVKKTSDAKAYPKGNATIPRAAVTLLKLETRGSNWRTVGTVIGVIGGLTLGGYIAGKTANSPGAGLAIFVGTASAVTIAGRAAGGAADRNVTMIRIIE